MKKRNFLIILLLLIQLTVLIFFGNQKCGMHFDECFSFFNTNNSYGRYAADREWLSSYDIKKDFYVIPGGQFNYKYVYDLQSYDVHPPVYYFMLHTLCSVMPGVFSMWQGIGLNILFSLICSVFLFFIIEWFIKNEYLTFLICLSTVLNPGVISNVMFIRMYTLMTMWIFISIYLHLRMSEYDNSDFPFRLIIFNSVIAYLGFLTHYFYLVFLFFIEAAFFIPRLFRFKNNYKGILKYLFSILLAGIIAVISYPYCLGHVNSGYRGTEVKSYLINIKDFGQRFIFFGSLINKYVFGNVSYIFLLIILLLLVTAYYLSSRNNTKFKLSNNGIVFLQCLLIPVAGYFLVSTKASLIGDDAMMRYQLPIYGLIVAIYLLLIYWLLIYIFANKENNKYFAIMLICFMLIVDVYSLYKSNVFYLYKEQENMTNIASSHSDDTCIYIYNNENNKYFLWNDAMQLWQYNKIYFINSENEDLIDDFEINNAEELVVYVSKLSMNDDFSFYDNIIKRSNKIVTSSKELYESTYAVCYEYQ